METTLNTLLIVLLAVAGLVGVLLTVLQLPGTWFIVLAAAGYAWYYDGARLGLADVGLLAGIAALAEIIELFAGMVIGRRGGASRRASWYGMAGGLAGAILLSVPVPLIGTILGAAIGCFAGAFVAEIQLGRGLQASARSGLFSAMGRALGSVLKLMAAMLIAGLAVLQAILSL